MLLSQIKVVKPLSSEISSLATFIKALAIEVRPQLQMAARIVQDDHEIAIASVKEEERLGQLGGSFKDTPELIHLNLVESLERNKKLKGGFFASPPFIKLVINPEIKVLFIGHALDKIKLALEQGLLRIEDIEPLIQYYNYATWLFSDDMKSTLNRPNPTLDASLTTCIELNAGAATAASFLQCLIASKKHSGETKLV